jgi:hypothetical protein
MDYKFVIILAILLGLIFLLVKEMNSIRHSISSSYEKTKLLIGITSKDNEQKMKTGLNSCIERIKLINGDYMVQIRKMNEMGRDLIVTTNSNNYSDSDSAKKSHKNKILYLSEGIEENFSKQNSQKKEDLFKINYSNSQNKDNKYKHMSEKNIPDACLDNEICENKENKENKEIKEIKENKSDESDESNKSNKSNKSDKSNKSNKSNQSEFCEKLIENMNFDESLDESEEDEEDDEEEEECENNESHDESYNGTSMDLESEINFSENSANSVKCNSKSITTSSSKNITKNKKLENENNSNNYDNSDNSDNSNKSIVTADITITYDTLQSVDKYNKKFLEKVAKNFGIPITYKEGNNRKSLVKNELYDKIKEKLARI